MFNDEDDAKQIVEFVGSKLYSYKMLDSSEDIKSKG